jgi:hypothetical protein
MSIAVKTSEAAFKILHSESATSDEKAVAASALSQTKSKDVTSKTVASKAGKILSDPKASRDAKAVAASALIRWPAKTPKNAAKIRNAVMQAIKK